LIYQIAAISLLVSALLWVFVRENPKKSEK